jgi:Transcription antiterminator
MPSRISRAALTLNARILQWPSYVVLIFCLAGGCFLCAQETAKPSIGTVTAVGPNSITLKTDAGSEASVAVGPGTRIVRTAPGQKDLKSATPIQLQDLQVGDRALVRSAGPDNHLTATSIVVMKKTDVAQKQQQEMQEWQRHGVGGIVRSVDPASGAIEVAAGMNQTVTVHTSPATDFLRYAPASVKFSDAKKGTLSDIRPGDQLRARGTPAADGRELTADAVISGAFRNIAGTVTSIDAAQNSVTVMELASRKPVTVKLAADSQMRKLPEAVAQRIAIFLRRGQGGAEAGAAGGAESHHEGRSGEAGAHEAAAAGNRQAGGPPDFQQLIRRMPPASISDLQKGQAVMMVTTPGGPNSEPTALTLLSGVEPILTAAPNQTTAANLLSGWSMGGGEGDAASQ